jgi:hypothetical protein
MVLSTIFIQDPITLLKSLGFIIIIIGLYISEKEEDEKKAN